MLFSVAVTMNNSEGLPAQFSRRESFTSLNKISNQDTTSMSALHQRSRQGNREHERKRDILMQGGRLLRERQTSEDATINSSGPSTFEQSSFASDSDRTSPKLTEPSRYSTAQSVKSFSSSPSLHNGISEEFPQETIKLKKQYNKRLLEIAELENDRTLLQYKSASLQDCLDDTNQEIRECIELSKRQASDMLFMKRKISSLESEKDSLQSQVQYRDEYLEKHNLTLPYIGSDGELVEAKVRDFADLLKEKEDELEEMKREKDSMGHQLQEQLEKHNIDRDSNREAARVNNDLKVKLKQMDGETLAAKNTISSKELIISKKVQLITELEESESKLREERRDLFAKNRELVYENDELTQTIDILQARIKRLNQSQMRADSNI